VGLRFEFEFVESEEILRAGPLAHMFISGDAEKAEAQPDAVIVRKPFREAELSRAINMALTTAPPQVREIMRLGRSATETVVAGDAAVWDLFACDGQARTVTQHHLAVRVIPR